MSGRNVELSVAAKDLDINKIREQLNSEEIRETEEETEQKQGEPFLYVRDDGTVDWDGALQDRSALKKIRKCSLG